VVGAATTLALVGFLLPPATWAQLPSANTVRANRFELVDAQGVVRGTWSVEEPIVGLRQVQLHLRDESGASRVRLETGPQASSIGLYDRSGSNGAHLLENLFDLGLVVGELSPVQGQTAGVLVSTGPREGHPPSFVIANRPSATATGWTLNADSDGRPQFEIRGPTGTSQWRAP
jgi:hypothetical protein